jgi:hypothetical protein
MRVLCRRTVNKAGLSFIEPRQDDGYANQPDNPFGEFQSLRLRTITQMPERMHASEQAEIIKSAVGCGSLNMKTVDARYNRGRTNPPRIISSPAKRSAERRRLARSSSLIFLTGRRKTLSHETSGNLRASLVSTNPIAITPSRIALTLSGRKDFIIRRLNDCARPARVCGELLCATFIHIVSSRHSYHARIES